MDKYQYRHYLLVLLTVVGAFNYLDRQVLSLAMEPIKQEFQLSDGQLGILSGFAFALFYAVAGIPIARWADRGNRNIIVSLTTGLWSFMLVLCGVAGNFTQLLLARVGVAIGEAGCLPPTQSLIADHFDRAERPRAMAIYWLCGPLAVIIGFLAGGWLIESVGWHTTFILMGVPGILLALLVRFTLREPRLEHKSLAVDSPPPFKAVLTVLWRQRTFRSIVTAFCIAYFFGNGLVQWLPSFFIRSHGMDIGELGAWFALVWGLCGLIGTWLGGFLAVRYAAGKEALQMQACAYVFGLCGLLYMMVFLSPNQHQALICMAALGITTTVCNGAIFSAIQSLVNERIRSVALAIIFLLANLIGLGLGPMAVGLLSDVLVLKFGPESLRYALAIMSPGFVWVGFHYWKAADTIEDDIRSIESKACSAEVVGNSSEPDAKDEKKNVLFESR